VEHKKRKFGCMLIREAKPKEVKSLLEAGYKLWNKGRTFEEYYKDNTREDSYGTRYVLEENGAVVSSLILLRLGQKFNCDTYGIGSVFTDKAHAGKGYATILINSCIGKLHKEDCIIFLYSEIEPAFYERLHFRVLPDRLQKKPGCYCMASCSEAVWDQIIQSDIDSIPDYF
jgi:GNAT superfamily N-acetyltransferase